jgi:zinc protease
MKFNYVFPPMDEFALDNGLSIICVPDHEQNGLVLALQIPVGRFSDPPQREGLCELTTGLLAKGTETFSPDEFAAKLENAGATLFSDVGEEHCVLGIRMLASSAGEFLPLFIEMITRPRFAQEEFKRHQREMITALQAEAVDTSFLATRHFYSELAGKSHPAGRFQTVESLKCITVEDVLEFFDDYYAPEGSICVLAGDFEASAFKRFAAEQFSLWKRLRRKKSVIAKSIAGQPMSRVVRFVDKPDITQTSLAIGHASPGENCPEKNALLLANHIFGGGNFSSRLMTRIRTADGKTYGISSQIMAEAEFGTFLISTSTRNSELGSVLSSVIEEYKRFCDEGVTPEELDKARQYAIGNMAFQLEGIGNIVDKLLWLRFYNRPNSYIERFEELMTAIEVSSVNSAIRTYLSPERLIIVAVGKKSEVAQQLKPFGTLKHFHFRDKF